jgi:hypothetical protein
MKLNKRSGIITTVMMTLVMLSAATTAQGASSCSMGASGTSYNQIGEAAVFKNLTAMQGMNCASARYVMNKWLRRAYQQGYNHKLPTRFWDGYVTWHCWTVTSTRWRCEEYDSNTAFSFTAYRP